MSDTRPMYVRAGVTTSNPVNGAPLERQDDPHTDASAPPAPTLSQRPFVQNALPFLSSLTVHAVIIILGVATAQVIMRSTPPLMEVQTTIPISTWTDGPPGGVLNSGPQDADQFKLFGQEDAAAASNGLSTVRSPNLEISADAGGADSSSAATVLTGFGNVVQSGSSGTGTGSKGGHANGSGVGGPLARFGTPDGGALGPTSPMFGRGGNVRRIVYVCDATGTMLSKFAGLRQELANAVNALKPLQSFNVIFFYDNGKVGTINPDALVPASADNKRKTFSFMENFTTGGTTDPIPALRAAFKQQPELIYFLSDGEFNNISSYKDATSGSRI